jgi:ABC-2 type transport system ATP-binding protein
MLEARHLSRRFHGMTVVHDVSFVLDAGEVLGYLGPNGSGKTTTLRMLTGGLEPNAGHVLLDGRSIDEIPIELRRRIGYVPEEPHLYPFLSGREYLELVGRLREIPRALLTRKIDALLELFGLADAGDQEIAAYSKGMKQKVLVGAALLHDPDVLILDEPESGLDVGTSVMLRHLVRAFSARGKAVLYSSHVLEAVEKVCSRVIVLHRGRVVADDSVARLEALMSLASLEEVFAELAIRSDPAAIAREIVAVTALRA